MGLLGLFLECAMARFIINIQLSPPQFLHKPHAQLPSLQYSLLSIWHACSLLYLI